MGKLNENDLIGASRYNKAPKWVRERISQLIMWVNEAREHALKDRQPLPSDIYTEREQPIILVHPYSKEFGWSMPGDTQVRFINKDGSFDVRVNHWGQLEVMHQSVHGRRLMVVPRAANMVYLLAAKGENL